MLSSNPPPDPELLDVVDATGYHLGVAERGEVHRQGLWHQVFHCLVVRPGPEGAVVLQRRAPQKRAFANLLDFSATGHLSAGESPTDGIRELNEELGASFDRDRLVPLGTRLLADDSGEAKNRERIHAFLIADERRLDEYNPPANEVSALVEARATDLLDLLAGSTDRIRASQWQPGQPIQAIDIEVADLVPGGYWTVLLIMAERFARGETPLGI